MDKKLAQKIFDWCKEHFDWFGEGVENEQLCLEDGKIYSDNDFCVEDYSVEMKPLGWLNEVYEEFHPEQMIVRNVYHYTNAAGEYTPGSACFRLVAACVQDGELVLEGDFCYGEYEDPSFKDFFQFSYQADDFHGYMLGTNFRNKPDDMVKLCFKDGNRIIKELVELWPRKLNAADEIESAVINNDFCLTICDSEIPLLNAAGRVIDRFEKMDLEKTFKGTEFEKMEFLGIQWTSDGEIEMPKLKRDKSGKGSDLCKETMVMSVVWIDFNVSIGSKMGLSMDAWMAKQVFKWCKEQYSWFAEACNDGKIVLEGNKIVSSEFSIPFEDDSIIFDWTIDVYKQFKPDKLSVRNLVHVTDDNGVCNPHKASSYIVTAEAHPDLPAAYRFRRLMDICFGKFDCVTDSGETREYYYQLVDAQEAFLLVKNFREEENPHNIALRLKKDEQTAYEVVEIWPLSTLEMDEDTLARKMECGSVKTEDAIINDEFFLAVGGYHAIPLLDSEGSPVSMLEAMDVQRTFAGTIYEDWTFEGIEYEFGKVEPLIPAKSAKKIIQEESEAEEFNDEFEETESTLIINIDITFKKENGDDDCELAQKIFDWCCEQFNWFGEHAKNESIYLSDSRLASNFQSEDQYLDEEPITWMEKVFEHFHPAQMNVCTQYEYYEGYASDHRYIVASVENGKFVVKDDFIAGQVDYFWEDDYPLFYYRNKGCYGLMLGEDSSDPAFTTALCFKMGQESREEVVEIRPYSDDETEAPFMDDIKSSVRKGCICLAICDNEIPLLDSSGQRIHNIDRMDAKKTFEGTKLNDYEFIGIRFQKDAEPEQPGIDR
ncbi:MAG: hypothetical protein MJY87_02905 [Fibrobacter sp.]|nr:hypothetical protein [Fibrobacter sp.]